MNGDWRDALGALAASLPDGDPPAADVTDSAPAAHRSVTLYYERKGRSGKPATILTDFAGIEDSAIAELASELKRTLATGGSARGGEILIQGDRRVELRRLLSERGFKVKG